MKKSVSLPCTVKKKTPSTWISSCPALDVFAQGETEEKAKENLQETIALFFVSCHERGTLPDVLRECGIDPQVENVYMEWGE